MFSLHLLQNTRILPFLLLSLLLSGQTRGSPAVASSLSGKQEPSSIFSRNPITSFTKAGLFIDSAQGIVCPSGNVTPGSAAQPGMPLPGLPPNNLVFASKRLTYDRNELQQIRNFALGKTQVLPKTLRWTMGGPTGTQRKFLQHGASNVYVVDCALYLDLTNTSNSTLQITRVGVQLLDDPTPNTYQYRLIDICTLKTAQCRISIGGGPGQCSAAFVTVKLKGGEAGNVFSQAISGSPCHALTLAPKEAKRLLIYFYSPKNLLYSVLPQLIVVTPNGKQTLLLPELAGTLAFANDKQFKCYGLKGDTFVEEKPFHIPSNCL